MRRIVVGVVCALGVTCTAHAQDAELAAAADTSAEEDPRDARLRELEARIEALEVAPSQTATPASEDEATAEAPAEATTFGPLTFGGWVEAYYGWNFNQPSNGITDLRGFDNRHGSFNLAIVALDTQLDWEGVNGRITLQWGSTPATYYLAETAAPSLGAAIGPQNQALWQMIQQAYVGYRIPIGSGLNIQAGLFLSPVGVEGMSVHDNWFYSRANLFFGFPFYHTGIRASYAVVPELTVTLWAINGWNTVLDNNTEKSFIVQLAWTPDADVLSLNFSYVSGVERPTGAAEGRAWRHTFDLNGTFTPLSWLGFQGQLTGGFEPNDFGTSAYFAGLLSMRFQIVDWLYFGMRGDFFWERNASNAMGTASSIFWPVEWVSSGTAMIDVRPHEHVSLRLEYRHDQAAGDGSGGACARTGQCAYFAGSVTGDGALTPFVRNAAHQDTLTLGVTAWF